MTINEPETLRRQIAHTQENLATDVDRLTEKVSPSAIVERRVEKGKNTLRTMREKIMGATDDATSSMSDTVSSAGDTASSAASTVQDNLQAAPQLARDRTQGNPLAAGLIAFGAGWLLSSLLPASTKEKELAGKGKEFAQEHASAVTGPLAETAGQLKDELREPAQQAVQSVQSTATEAADTVKNEATSAGSDVAGHAQDSAQSVKHTATP